MTSLTMGFWLGLSYQKWITFCRAGLKSSSKAGSYPVTFVPLLHVWAHAAQPARVWHLGLAAEGYHWPFFSPRESQTTGRKFLVSSSFISLCPTIKVSCISATGSYHLVLVGHQAQWQWTVLFAGLVLRFLFNNRGKLVYKVVGFHTSPDLANLSYSPPLSCPWSQYLSD